MNDTILAANVGGDLLSPAAVAKYLHLSRQSVYRLIARGLLPVHKFCRHLRVRRTDVEELIDRSREMIGFSEYGRSKD